VTRVLDERPLLDGESLAAILWAARYYHHPAGEAVAAALPAALRSPRELPPEGIVALQLTEAGRDAQANARVRTGTRIATLLAALADAPMAQAEATVLAGGAAARRALSQHWIERVRLPANAARPAARAAHPL